MAVGSGVDRQHLCIRIGEGQRERAPAQRVADREDRFRVKPGEQALEEIDFLKGDAEPIGKAFAILETPGEWRLREIVEMAGVESGGDVDAALLIERCQAANDRHAAPAFKAVRGRGTRGRYKERRSCRRRARYGS